MREWRNILLLSLIVAALMISIWLLPELQRLNPVRRYYARRTLRRQPLPRPKGYIESRPKDWRPPEEIEYHEIGSTRLIKDRWHRDR